MRRLAIVLALALGACSCNPRDPKLIEPKYQADLHAATEQARQPLGKQMQVTDGRRFRVRLMSAKPRRRNANVGFGPVYALLSFPANRLNPPNPDTRRHIARRTAPLSKKIVLRAGNKSVQTHPIRLNRMIQLTSQLAPASGEKACSQTGVSSPVPFQMNRTRIGRPSSTSSA